MKLVSTTSFAAKTTDKPETISTSKATLHQAFMHVHFLKDDSPPMTSTISAVKLAVKEKASRVIRIHG